MKSSLKAIFGICMAFLVLSAIIHVAHLLLHVIVLAVAVAIGYQLYKEGIVKDWFHKMKENN